MKLAAVAAVGVTMATSAMATEAVNEVASCVPEQGENVIINADTVAQVAGGEGSISVMARSQSDHQTFFSVNLRPTTSSEMVALSTVFMENRQALLDGIAAGEPSITLPGGMPYVGACYTFDMK